VTNQPTPEPTAPAALADETTDLLPAPGGWVTTSDLAEQTGRDPKDIQELLRRAALQGQLVDGSLLKAGGPGTWHRPTAATVTTHRLVTGPVGSGKTTALHALWAVECAEPTIITWVCDPTGSLDPDTTSGHDRYTAGRDGSVDMLTEACEVIGLRQAVAAAGTGDGTRQFTATADAPLIIVTVDDAHLPLDDPFAVDLVERIARTGRPHGVVPRAATTANTITALGGYELWRGLNNPA
jgi:hypothetical protein